MQCGIADGSDSLASLGASQVLGELALLTGLSPPSVFARYERSEQAIVLAITRPWPGMNE